MNTLARALGLVVGLVVSSSGLSACASGAAGRSETQSHSISKKVGEKLMKVQELAAKKDWQGALDALAKVEESKYLSDHERARIFQIRAGLLAGQDNAPDPVKNTQLAAEALEKALALDALDEVDQLATMFNLGELYIMLERFPDAAEMLAAWVKRSPNPDPRGYFLTASSYAQAGRFAEAAPFAEEAVKRAPKPEEPWLRLQVSVQYELKQDAKVAAGLEQLVAAFPGKVEDWLQLAETYNAMGQGAQAIATLEKAQAKGLLTQESQLLRLAQLYVEHDAPKKAGELLDHAFDEGTVSKSPVSLETYTRAWLAAKEPEHAAKVLRANAQASGSAETWLLLGRLESEREQWAAAQAALAQALKLGGLGNEGEAHIMLGVALYNQRQVDAALRSWEQAKKFAPSAKEAAHWIAQAKGGKPAKRAGGKP